MAQGLPHPILFSTLADMDYVTIAGHQVEFKHVFYTWCAMFILFVCGLCVRFSIQKYPKGIQHFFEVLIEFLENFAISNMGEKARKVMPFLIPLFLFIVVQNVLGLIPGCDAPTANINTNAAMALGVFIYYNMLGIAIWGFGYIKHFLGPVPAIAPLMLPIEIISHLARPLSLTLRLFGNIKGEEIVLVLFFLLAPIIGTIPIYFLFLLAKVMQAFIFYMLAMLYITGAMEHAH